MTFTVNRANNERVRRATDHAARTTTTLAMLGDRLPSYEPRVTFSTLWRDTRHIRGVLGRNGLYRLLLSLDHAHLNEDLILRVAARDAPGDSVLLIRQRWAWERQRAYLRRFIVRGHSHPPRPVSYREAHARIRAERGPASAYVCGECGQPAEEWAYQGLSPDEQVGWVETVDEHGGSVDSLRLWSPVPADYAALCRRCHAELDASGALWLG